MKKFIIFCALVGVITFVACQNKQSNVEENQLNNVSGKATNKRTASVSQKSITFIPAINNYLTKKVGSKYSKGKYCIPFYSIVAVDESNPKDILVWGDFWVYNYNLEGDVLKTVSGGNHPGLMHIKQSGKDFKVSSFDEVADGANNLSSAQKIFGKRYNLFKILSSSERIKEIRRMQSLAKYVKENNIAATKYQDYGSPAKSFSVGRNK